MDAAGASPDSTTRLRGLNACALLRRALSPARLTTDAFQGWEPPPLTELARQFPGYELLALLGRGGMGAVYQARQLSLDRLVAIKILPVELSLREEFPIRFRREAQALARLTHPHVVSIHDSGQTKDGHFYFVMEYVNGGDLQQLLSQGKVVLPQAVEIVRQICDALEAAHQEGFVHRDMKPSNVLLDARGRVKVSDFGLAQLLGESGLELLYTRTSALLGTPEYAAPEQARHGTVDQRADLYSLGVIFYEMLTGNLPRGVFDPPSKKSAVGPALDRVVMRALQNEPDRRYQSAAEMRSALSRAVARKSGSRRMGWALPVAAFVLACGAIFAFRQPWKANGLASKEVAARGDEPFTNSLGQRFTPAGTPGVLFCTWETRVRDFETFVKEAGHWVQPGFDINEGGQWIRRDGADWQAPPGYAQTLEHPVVGIGWDDAVDFCIWLTSRERTAGLIARGDSYRLPTDFEWSIAAGLAPEIAAIIPTSGEDFPGIYPWGLEFPPPLLSGNFAGEEMREAGWAESEPVIAGYRDKHSSPAPVGNYGTQRYGLFDLGGNVTEWVMDSHPTRPGDRFLRGGSWVVGDQRLRSACRWSYSPDVRSTAIGFRIVFARAPRADR